MLYACTLYSHRADSVGWTAEGACQFERVLKHSTSVTTVETELAGEDAEKP